jgi:hypothetical protein
MRVAACKNGLPFDAAFSATDEFIVAWIVASGESEGGKFDWRSMEWLERK